MAKMLASTFVSTAKSMIGLNEADGSYKKVIDTYNSHEPLARGYKVKYTDAWCAVFISAVSIMCGYTEIIKTECSCSKMIELFKKSGTWEENDAYIPSPGDIIFYDWDDNGAGDNMGNPDHVGVVEKVEDAYITVIEGNISNKVGRRKIKVNGKYIRGFGVPEYDKPEEAVLSDKKNGTDSSLKPGYAKSFDKSLAGTYKTTSGLNLRCGAGTSKAKICVMPPCATVQNYGYYTEYNGTKWLYIKYKDYVGFASSKYLLRQ